MSMNLYRFEFLIDSLSYSLERQLKSPDENDGQKTEE